MRFYVEWAAAECAQFIGACLELHRQHPEYGKKNLVRHAMRTMPCGRRRTVTDGLVTKSAAELVRLGVVFRTTWGELQVGGGCRHYQKREETAQARPVVRRALAASAVQMLSAATAQWGAQC